MRRLLLLAIFLIAPVAWAQEQQQGEDPSRPGFFQRLFGTDSAESDEEQGTLLERLIQDSLSGAGRSVRVTGFSGALSGRATMDSLTIADDEGIWFTMTDAVLDWNRSALLRGSLEVEEISAASIELPRLPAPSETMEPLTPEATGFRLPELPVSVDIGRIAADSVEIGAPVVGIEAAVSVEGSLSLADGEGEADLEIGRLDGQGALSLDAGYNNESEQLRVDFSLQEAEGGLLATLIGLPGSPAVVFTITGDAPLSEFVADIGLATDGEQRLAGQVRLGQTEDARTIAAEIGGDIAPVFAPEYRDFFGDRIALDLDALLFDDGRIGIPDLSIVARELELDGTIELGADRVPIFIDLTGRIAPESGPDVLLPVAGEETRVEAVDLTLQFDASESEDWNGGLSIENLSRADFSAETLRIGGAGRIRSGLASAFTAELDFAATGIASGIDGLAEALGRDIEGVANIERTENGRTEITGLELTGKELTLAGDASIGAELRTEGTLSVRADRVADFSTLAGRELEGAAELETRFAIAPLAGTFEVTAKGQARDIQVSDNYADPLLLGLTELDLRAVRSESGFLLDIERLVNDAVRVSGIIDLRSGGSRATTEIALTDVSLLLPELEGPATLLFTGQEDPDRDWKITADLRGPTLTAIVTGEASGLYEEEPAFDGRVELDAGNLSAFSEIAGRPLSGQLRLTAEGGIDAALTRADIVAEAEGAGLSIGDPRFDALLAGPLSARVVGTMADEAFDVSEVQLSTGVVRLDGSGRYSDQVATLTVDGDVSDLSALSELASRPLAGRVAVKADGSFSADLMRGDVTADIDGNDISVGEPGLDRLLAGALSARVVGSRSGEAFDVTELSLSTDVVRLGGNGSYSNEVVTGTLDGSVADLSGLSQLAGRPLTGSVALKADGSFRTDLTRADVTAEIDGENLSIGQPAADRLLAGTLKAVIDARRDGDFIEVDTFDLSTDLLSATASGRLGAEDSNVDIDARLADLAPFVDGFPGALTVDGTVGRRGGQLVLDLDAVGPGGARASLDGTVSEDMSDADLDITGNAPLGLADRFIAPFNIAGLADFDLRLDGPVALRNLSGRVATAGGRFAAPTLYAALSDITGDATLSGGRAQLDFTSRVDGGGRIAITGPIGLSAPFDGALEVVLTNARVTDPRLFESSVDGRITMTGPMTGGARIAGRLELGQTDIRIPSTGLGGSGDVPEIIHINEPPPVRGTRRRAGLLDRDEARGGGGPVYPLDVLIVAPNRVFVRGRGLDAEFGGRLQLTGTTRDIVPIGAFNLIRGRMDILSRRLELEEARITIQGEFVPFLRIRASTRAEDYNVGVDVVGPADDPEITFSSTPDLPQEEVLSRLIFGRGIETLSPIQAARLALAVRTLAGGGGEGVVDKIRGGSGLADLDLTTTEDGNTAVRAGAYLGENIYTDVTVDSAGETRLQLNLDITPSLKARGGVSNTGDTSLGIFFERDY